MLSNKQQRSVAVFSLRNPRQMPGPTDARVSQRARQVAPRRENKTEIAGEEWRRAAPPRPTRRSQSLCGRRSVRRGSVRVRARRSIRGGLALGAEDYSRRVRHSGAFRNPTSSSVDYFARRITRVCASERLLSAHGYTPPLLVR